MPYGLLSVTKKCSSCSKSLRSKHRDCKKVNQLTLKLRNQKCNSNTVHYKHEYYIIWELSNHFNMLFDCLVFILFSKQAMLFTEILVVKQILQSMRSEVCSLRYFIKLFFRADTGLILALSTGSSGLTPGCIS